MLARSRHEISAKYYSCKPGVWETFPNEKMWYIQSCQKVDYRSNNSIDSYTFRQVSLIGIAICWSESDLFRQKEEKAINLLGDDNGQHFFRLGVPLTLRGRGEGRFLKAICVKKWKSETHQWGSSPCERQENVKIWHLQTPLTGDR